MTRLISTTICCVLLTSILTGCQGNASGDSTSQSGTPQEKISTKNTVEPETESKSKTSDDSDRSFKLKIKNGEGETSNYLKFDGEDGKWLSADQTEIYRLKINGRKLKIVDPEEKVLGYVVADEDRFKLEDADKQELFEFQRSGSDWKFKENEEMQFRIKQRSYGFEIETPQDVRKAKVKFADGKTSLRDAEEKTLFYTKDKLKPLALIALGLEPLTEHHRIGLALAIQVELGK